MQPGLVFVGSHRRAHHADTIDIGLGLYVFRRGDKPGQLQPVGMIETPQPGWIATHPRAHCLYAVNEVRNFAGSEGGGVSAFAISDTGALTLLNSRPTPALPCHCEVDASGRFLLVATFGGGSVHLFPLNTDGSIGPEADRHQHSGSSVHPRRQAGPHAHAAAIDPANRFVLVPDLGTDQVEVYELMAAQARLAPRPERAVQLPPGSGPRHVAFGPQARFVYVINEMSATVTALRYDGDTGAMQAFQTVDLLPNGFAGLRSGAEIALHPGGRYLYASTRSHGSSGVPPIRGQDSIVWFDIDPVNGGLALAGRTPSGGQIPRSFAFDSGGELLFVGHQCSGTVVTFRIDPQTGAPTPTGDAAATPVPVCVHIPRPA